MSASGQLHPARAGVARFDRAGDELHAAKAVVDRWKIVFRSLQRLAVDVGADRPHDADIDGGESFEIPFGVTGGDAGRILGGLGEVAVAKRPGLARLAIL